jgi:hypothetical protein
MVFNLELDHALGYRAAIGAGIGAVLRGHKKYKAHPKKNKQPRYYYRGFFL